MEEFIPKKLPLGVELETKEILKKVISGVCQGSCPFYSCCFQ